MNNVLPPVGLTRAVLSAIPDREADLVVLSAALAACKAEVTALLQRFAFDRYFNWGLHLDSAPPTVTNYFLTSYSSDQTVEYHRRLAALDIDGLRAFLTLYCRDRYASSLTSLYAYGGYLYGLTEEVDDLDLLVVLKNNSIIEKDITVDCGGALPSLVRYMRRPQRYIGLAAISRGQIHEATENNSVLRSAVIAGTTAVCLWGEPFQVTPVPVAILLYHAVELMTWGFKAYFDEDVSARRRAIWRVIEAGYILTSINQVIGPNVSGATPALEELTLHLKYLAEPVNCSLEHFLSGVAILRPQVAYFKEIIRQLALQAIAVT